MSIIKNTGAVILAGGKALRMGGRDKPFQLLQGRPLIMHVMDILADQLPLVISANHNINRYEALGVPVVRDIRPGYAGPLAGIHAAMKWYADTQEPGVITHLAVLPADVPRFPASTPKLLARAFDNSPDVEISWLQTNGQLQPLFSLWSTTLLPDIEAALAEGAYSPMRFIQGRRNLLIQLKTFQAYEFINVNTLEQLDTLAGSDLSSQK